MERWIGKIMNRLEKRLAKRREAQIRKMRMRIERPKSMIPLIRSSKKYHDWYKEVLARSCYRCAICEAPLELEAIQIHHKIPVSKIIKDNRLINFRQALDCKELWDLENGIALCFNCHAEKHPDITFF